MIKTRSGKPQDTELAALLQRITRSDANSAQLAFKRLYQLTSPYVYGVLLRMFRQEAAAEDALQETFIRVWDKAGSYDETQGKPLTWITSIARYHALDVLRSQTSSRDRDTDYARTQEQSVDTFQSLDRQIGDGQVLSLCLERLEPDVRDCLVQAYCGGFTHQELSDITGTALGTVKSWIKRSLKSLRECIDELS